MNMTNHKKLSIKNLLSLVGIAGASVFLTLPVLAQSSPTNNSGSSVGSPAMTGDRMPTDDRAMPGQTNMGTQQLNNGTSNTINQQTDSGSPAATERAPTDDRLQTENTSNTETQQIRRSTTTQQINPSSTTPATQPYNTNPAAGNQQIDNTTSTTPSATQETTDQGVRALW